MTFSINNISDVQRHDIVTRMNDDTFKKLIPSICFYIVLSVVGTVGNILAIYIFLARMKRNLQNNLFVLLSSVNLLACGVCLPLEVLDVRNMYNYPNILTCKISRFLNMYTMLVSTLTLCTTAIFRLGAARSGSVVSIKRSTHVAGIVIPLVLSACIAWIAPIVFGRTSNPTFVAEVKGHDCSIADDIKNTAWPTVFNVVLCIGFAVLIMITIIAYVCIWRIVKKSRRAVTFYAETTNGVPCEHNENIECSGSIKNRTVNADIVNRNTNFILAREDKQVQLVIPSKKVLDRINISDKTSVVAARLKSRNMSIATEPVKDNVHGSYDIDLVTSSSNRSTSDSSIAIASACIATSSRSDCINNEMNDTCMKGNLGKSLDYLSCEAYDNTDINSDKNSWSASDKHKVKGQPLPTIKQQAGNKTDDQRRVCILTNSTIDSSFNEQTKTSVNNISKRWLKKKGNVSRTSLESAITRTAFLLTLTYVVSYVPFLLVSIPRTNDVNIDYSQDTVKLNLINAALRLYFIMPAISPFIFWASNLDFRRKFWIRRNF